MAELLPLLLWLLLLPRAVGPVRRPAPNSSEMSMLTPGEEGSGPGSRCGGCGLCVTLSGQDLKADISICSADITEGPWPD